jgi:16S rRNA processing protein RimM
MANERVCLGEIAGAHGVRGAVRVRSFTRNPADVAAYGALTDEAGRRKFVLAIVGQVRGQLIATIEGVKDRDAAEALRGVRLFVERAQLPAPGEEEYYHSDLLGMRCICVDGTTFGVVKAVDNFGAGDVIEVERPDGTRAMLSFTRAVVPSVDLGAGLIVVEPPEETAEAEGAPS